MVISSLDSLIERVLAEDARKQDLLADTRRMSVAVEEGEVENHVLLSIDGENGSGTETLGASAHALGQMATDLGIPKRYFDRMKAEAPDDPGIPQRGRAGHGSRVALGSLPATRQHRDRHQAAPGVRPPLRGGR